jgi:hypothetical protein
MSEATAAGGIEINPSELKHPTLAFLRDYWNGKRAGRAMPTRADIRPADLKEHLGWITLIDVLPGARDFRYRLIGTLITEYFFWDATGKTVTEAFAALPKPVCDAVLGVYRCVVESRAPLRAYGDMGWAGKGIEACEAVYLPLSDDGETVHFILQAFVFDRESVLMARHIARANDGQLVEQPRA